MRKIQICVPFPLAMLLLVVAAASTVAHAQNFSVLYNFGSKSGDPVNPFFSGIVTQGRDGSLYSTTGSGGANGAGAIFKITPTGTLTVLYSFTGGSDGADPDSGLTLGTDGNFYGTTVGGGANADGTVFKITPAGTHTVLHSFNCTDGCEPIGGLIQGTDGKFYGTTFAADGTVFKISSAGGFTTIHTFNFVDGSGPNAVLVQGSDGNFYGTTDSGGMFGFGTIFKITSGGTFTQLHSFNCTDGCVPVDGLVQGADGAFYGTTREGGTNGNGTVFKIIPGGALTTLHDFSGADGAAPFGGLVLATDGNFYGTTSSGGTLNDGTIFRISPTGSSFSVLYNFDGTTGSTPYVTPFQHTNGLLYGDTELGGTGHVSPCTPGNCGVFYSLNASLRAFVSLLSYSGKVGKTIEILGQGFTSATTVSFNGTAVATPSVKSGTYLTAAVPKGATTGLVTVTTSGGKLTSNRTFHVTPQITSFSPTSGAVGTVVTIMGVSLTQTTKVTFGGVAAVAFQVSSDTQVVATLPTGAKTGKIAITTLGGTATSATNFRVTPLIF